MVKNIVFEEDWLGSGGSTRGLCAIVNCDVKTPITLNPSWLWEDWIIAVVLREGSTRGSLQLCLKKIGLAAGRKKYASGGVSDNAALILNKNYEEEPGNAGAAQLWFWIRTMKKNQAMLAPRKVTERTTCQKHRSPTQTINGVARVAFKIFGASVGVSSWMI